MASNKIKINVKFSVDEGSMARVAAIIQEMGEKLADAFDGAAKQAPESLFGPDAGPEYGHAGPCTWPIDKCIGHPAS